MSLFTTAKGSWTCDESQRQAVIGVVTLQLAALDNVGNK